MPAPQTYEACLDELRQTRHLCYDLFEFIFEEASQAALESSRFEELRDRMIGLEFIAS